MTANSPSATDQALSTPTLPLTDPATLVPATEASAAAAAAATGSTAVIWVTGSVTLLALLAVTLVRLVGPDQRLVVFRAGRPAGVRGPGPVLLLPGLERGVRVTVGPEELDLMWVEAQTGDGMSVTISGTATTEVTDSATVAAGPRPISVAVASVIRSQLRLMVANATLAEVARLNQRDLQDLTDRCREHTRDWGIEVTSIEISRVEILLGADLIRWAERFAGMSPSTQQDRLSALERRVSELAGSRP